MKKKVHSSFINNDRHVGFYILDIVVDGSRPTLKINIIERYQEKATISISTPPTHPHFHHSFQSMTILCDIRAWVIILRR